MQNATCRNFPGQQFVKFNFVFVYIDANWVFKSFNSVLQDTFDRK